MNLTTTKRSVAESIALLRRAFPGCLCCTECARLIASTPAGYAKSNLTPEQITTYVCAECRSDLDPKRSKEITTRFAASKAAAAASRLRAPLSGLSCCRCTERVSCASCVQQRTAEAAEGRRLSPDYLPAPERSDQHTCLVDGRHRDLDAIAECPLPSVVIDDLLAHLPPPRFCEHGRPAENCITHASSRQQTSMPVAVKSEREWPPRRGQAAEVTETQGACTGTAGASGMPSADPHKHWGSEGTFLSPKNLPKNSRRAGGRPRKHHSDRAAHAAAQRAYRQRKKQARLAANDAQLAALGQGA